MALRLNGSSSGYVELEVPAAAGSHTLTLPDSGGSSGQYLQTNGSGTLSWQTVSASNLTLGTAQAISSGTTINFEDIPSTAKRVQVAVYGLSASGTNDLFFRIGDSGGVESSGYLATGGRIYGGTSSGTDAYSHTDGWRVNFGGSAVSWNGILTLLNIEGNKWVASGTLHITESGYYVAYMFGGSKELSGTLDRVQLLLSGSDTFDAGTVNIAYEV